MTTSELIEILSAFPGDVEVVLYADDPGDNPEGGRWAAIRPEDIDGEEDGIYIAAYLTGTWNEELQQWIPQ